ncbi:MAG TPA: DMT family transporter [Thermoanaerobaculia bacterium]|nr:DMT family transporter [Thermoanaerobaculia bacterium]
MTVFLFIAVLAGIAVALQGQFMGTMTRAVGTGTSVLITYGIGALVAVVVWLTRRDPAVPIRDVPWYAWSAGILGLVIVGGIGFATPRLGLSRTIVITIAAQLAAAIVIDHFGWFGAQQRAFDVMRGAGMALTIIGAWLVVR